MERLTREDWKSLNSVMWEKVDDLNIEEKIKKDIQDVLKRLAAYEDLEEQCLKETSWGLEMLFEKWNIFHEEIQELFEYKELEEQGKLLKMPCAVGDTVYSISWRKWCVYKEDYIGVDFVCLKCGGCQGKMEYFVKEIPATLACIANIVWHKANPSDDFWTFLTREEAEAALVKYENRRSNRD